MLNNTAIIYDLDFASKSFSEIIDAIGESKKLIMKGGRIDERRVHLKLIDDWQKGKILLKK